jgi:hypothetical protein
MRVFQTVQAWRKVVSKVDDLRASATSKPLQGEDTEVVLAIKGESEIDDAIYALDRYFLEDNRRKAVLLELQGERVGYLNRQDFCSSGPEVRLGEAQGSALAGISAYKFITLKCPVEGCNAQLPLVVRFDEAAPPYCPKHRNKVLQVER